MAGGKETPRQKLIGLMYLVLLAMLALQVSSIIIEKFQMLNVSIEASNTSSEKQSLAIMNRIKHAVENNKRSAKDVAVQEKATLVRQKSKSLIQYIQQVKQQLVSKSGGMEDGKLKGGKDEESVAQVMLGPVGAKRGAAFKLQKDLNNYAAYLNTLMSAMKIKKSFNKLALDAIEDPMFMNDSEQKRKTFAEINFEGTPVVAALAVLSEKESALRGIEKEALTLLSEKIGGEIIPVDRVRPVVLSKSNYIVAGLNYEADLFMAAYSSSFKPNMTYQGNSLKVNETGVGGVKFRTSSSQYDAQGVAKKIWKGTITYPKPGGGDSIYQIEQEYYVVKPAIQVMAASIQSLYRNCGNELDVQVPALGAEYNPIFSATGAKLIARPQKGKVVVVPSASKVTLGVVNNGSPIGNVTYTVKELPLPSIDVKANGQKIDPIQGISANGLRKLKVIVKADKSVASLLPQDTKYSPRKCKVTLASGKHVKGIAQFDGVNTSSLRNLAQQANSGDRVIVEVEQVVRKNFQGKILPVPMPTEVVQVMIK